MLQIEIFKELDGNKSREIYKKQRRKWSRRQQRIIDILADPLNSLMTNRDIARECNIAESYIYKLYKNPLFLQEVERRRKSDDTIIQLRVRLWKALFYKIENSPAKIRTALEALGDLKPVTMNNVLQMYEKLTNDEVDNRLAQVMRERQKVHEFSTDEN